MQELKSLVSNFICSAGMIWKISVKDLELVSLVLGLRNGFKPQLVSELCAC